MSDSTGRLLVPYIRLSATASSNSLSRAACAMSSQRSRGGSCLRSPNRRAAIDALRAELSAERGARDTYRFADVRGLRGCRSSTSTSSETLHSSASAKRRRTTRPGNIKPRSTLLMNAILVAQCSATLPCVSPRASLSFRRCAPTSCPSFVASGFTNTCSLLDNRAIAIYR
jgi:hypothetical protein